MSFLYDLFLYVYFDFWVRYSINQKKMEYEDDTISKLIVFDVVTKQIVY